MRLVGLIESARALKTASDDFGPNIVHLHTEVPEACWTLSSLLFLRCRRKKLVRTIHNSVLWPKWKAVGWIVDMILNRGTLIAVSNGAKKGYEDFRNGNPLVQREVLVAKVIYNCISRFRPQLELAKQLPEPIRIVYAGRLEYQKGADLLPSIISKLNRFDSVSLSIDIIGEGSYRLGIEDKIAEIEPHFPVRYLPPVSNLNERLSDYDILLMPSRFEGFGIVAVEAIMAGVLPVVSSCSGLTEILPVSYRWFGLPGDANSIAESVVEAIGEYESWKAILEELQATCAEKFGEAEFTRSYIEVYFDQSG